MSITYPIKARLETVRAKSGRQVGQILLKSKTQFQDVLRNKHLLQSVINRSQRKRLQVQEENKRVVLGRIGRVRRESDESASELEDRDMREGTAVGFVLLGTVIVSETRLPFCIKGDDG